MRLFNKKENSLTEGRLLDKFNLLRGVFAILIVLGHCSMQFLVEPLPLYIIHKFNYIWVCYFFFVSGWSMSYHFDIRTDYLRGFSIKIFRLIFYAVEMRTFSGIIKCFIYDECIETHLYNLFKGWNWYVYELIILYIVFYICYKRLKSERIRLYVIVCVTVLVSVAYWALYSFSTFGDWTFAYYYSTWSWAFGIVVHYLFKYKSYDVSNTKNLVYSIMLALISIPCVKLSNNNFWGGVVLRNLFGIAVMIFMFYLMHYIKIKEVFLIKFLTKHATYIYFYQFLTINLITRLYSTANKNIDYGYVLIVISVLLVFSMGIRWLNIFLNWMVNQIKFGIKKTRSKVY